MDIKYDVLLVDDDPLILKLIGRYLELGGYRVRCHKSGKTAIECLKENIFDVVITDLAMEPVGGIEVLKQVKMLSPETRVIILTGYGDMESAIDAIRLKADDFILKPCEPDELYFRVDRCLDILELRRKVRKAQTELERKVEERTAALRETNKQLKLEIEERRRAEEVLRRYELIISTVRDPMSFIDRNYVYRTVNEVYVKWHRKPGASTGPEIVGTSVADLFGTRVFEGQMKKWLDRCLAGEEVHYQDLLEFPDGKKRHMDIRYYPQFDKNRQVSGVIASSRDITDSIRTREKLMRRSRELSERVKELNCLYRISDLVGQHDISYEECLSRVVRCIPSAWHYPDITCARILVNSREFRTENFRLSPNLKTSHSLKDSIIAHGERIGTVEVCCFCPEHHIENSGAYHFPDGGPFLKEEAELITTIAGILGRYTEHRQAREKLLLYHHQLRSLSSELILTEERERRRIATDLHDRIGQNLAMARIRLGMLREKAENAGLTADADEIRKLVEQTIQDTRTLTFEISPPVLYKVGLEAAVEWLADQIGGQHGIRIRIEDDGKPKHMDDSLRVLIFRATRELLLNIVKHARARNVKISLTEKEEHIHIDIRDDGIGFESSQIGSHEKINGGFGLFSIRERLRHIGGYLMLESEPGKGTKVRLVSPLSKN